ncbi:hypothetical protein CRE_28561 [Caenorhabditis remanei]|uniref:Uncharacterized protein n=1 Tax=Caenorhabditis remanei TaxID=31234 RepID=E3LN22_CAERE|nr:hypothetical protein CRE_28561 [Caenorhabditis remanei]
MEFFDETLLVTVRTSMLTVSTVVILLWVFGHVYSHYGVYGLLIFALIMLGMITAIEFLYKALEPLQETINRLQDDVNYLYDENAAAEHDDDE